MIADILLAMALVSANPAPAQSAPALHPVEQNIIHYTNIERSRHGLPPLKLDTSLLQSARHHAAWMASAHSLQHTSAMVAENIAMGQSSSQQAVRDWMNSPGHRANILGRYTRVGAAAYTSANGSIYWCLQLLN
jgi:uncharacterized protein YkwD